MNKKIMKKTVAVLLLIAMVFTVAVPAFADSSAPEKSQLQKDAEAYALKFIADYNGDVYKIWDLKLLPEYTKFSVKNDIMTMWFCADYMMQMKKIPTTGCPEAIEEAKEPHHSQDVLLLVADVSSGSMKNMQVFIESELGWNKTEIKPLWPLGYGEILPKYDPKDISVTVNGVNLVLNQAPVIQNGRTLVPLRAIFEALDTDVSWNDKTRTVTAVNGKTTITLKIDQNTMMKDGKTIKLDVPAQIMNSRTMVPLRAVSEALGADVDWSELTKNVSVMK